MMSVMTATIALIVTAAWSMADMLVQDYKRRKRTWRQNKNAVAVTEK